MPPKRSCPVPSTAKAHKRSRGRGAKQPRGRREPAASSPLPGSNRRYLRADSPQASTSASEAVPVSLPSDDDDHDDSPRAVSCDYAEESGVYKSSAYEDEVERLRRSAQSEDSPAPTGTVSSDSGSSLRLLVAPKRDSPGCRPLNSTMTDGGLPIDMMPSPVAPPRSLPLEPRPHNATDEPIVSGRSRPLAPSSREEKPPTDASAKPNALPRQGLECEANPPALAGPHTPSQKADEASLTTAQEIPPCPLGLHRRMQLREMERYGVHFSGFLPRRKK
ncbi:hypothetical protein HPB50_017696 [Hyalomma asiaticum]|uniref:Uncharacterized protein n=1 Tax=Hyalomma asiaticum TaxID=266040 RepID=A0ACB7SGA7_HYAAI|nr:hypothetical protein HPB50_017696 [Hyalomma asiaticum]